VAGEGPNLRIRIGDPDRTVSGPQSYRIAYTVRGALNAFEDHDELYWNVNGADWSVPSESVSARLVVPAGALQRTECFQGPTGSTESCRMEADDSEGAFEATRPLRPGEQLTLVAGLAKGAVPPPEPILRSKPRGVLDYFEVTSASILATLATLGAGLALVFRGWWRHGRDRQFTSVYYLTENPEERTRPLIGKEDVVVEFLPPERLRPAQIGLLLDERADTKDVTATIIDLAVRGYLTITEVAPDGVLDRGLGRKDWLLERKRQDTSDLLEYERIAFDGLFETGHTVRLSDLKETYYATLAVVRDELYRSAAEQGWFPEDPEAARNKWLAGGLGVTALGIALTYGAGRFLGLGLVGIPVALAGVLLIPLSRAMARRTARGSELLRRLLGFREYMVTAEKDRQRFFENANIFAEYLPYAIVFGCVERWAQAFSGIEAATEAVGTWYIGGAYSNPLAFSHALESFNSNVSGVIASTPAASGGSGFSGGFSGGGVGGGGGGSW
jgi:hypothetical protein